MLDYFVSELLQAQPPELQDFLLRTSVLTRLSVALCDAVIGTPGSGSMLAAIDQAGLFLEAADASGEWYRYHGLFAEAMQTEARRRLGAAAMRRVSSVACQWYEQNGMLAEAVEVALLAGQSGRAADLLVQIATTPQYNLGHMPIEAASEFHTLRRWFEQIPERELSARPILFVSYATALLFATLVDQMPLPPAMLMQLTALLERAEAGLAEQGDRVAVGKVYAFRALILRECDAIAESVANARLALERLPAGELAWRSIALDAIGLGALADGALAEAGAALQEALECCEQIGNRLWVRANLGMLSYVLLERGSLRQAHARFLEMLAEAREQNDADDIGRVQLALGHIGYERNQLEAAWQAATEAYELGEHLQSDQVWVQAALLLARIQQAQGDLWQAQQRLYVTLAKLQAYPTPLRARLMREVEAATVLLQIAQGDLQPAQRWAQRCLAGDGGLPRMVRERELRVVARVRLAAGDAAGALDLLATLTQSARRDERGRCINELAILTALALAAQQRCEQAASELQPVLLAAAREGLVRSLLDEGEPLLAIIRIVAAGTGDRRLRDVCRALLQPAGSVAAGRAGALDEPLSPQERRVLRRLAQGRSNPQIASDLVVSVNTVRTHVQSIYRKLGVSNRVAASIQARSLGLLADEQLISSR
jgi:LuxR family maltose regulon positive regulatory protein